jgi:C1A family cysteine protease
MQALALFGAPPEKYLPYNVDRFEEEPEAFHYAMADNFEAVKYYRLDTPGLDRKVLLDNLKKNLAAGLPFVLGFTVYSSLSNDGWVPFPKKGDSFQGGHAIMVCGYDNKMGALLFKNSWGLGWGHKGYGWIPDSYILQGLADDVWSLVQADFVNTDLFK